MELIIISGQARVGKTTLANYLAKESFELGLVPKLLSFADPLKAIAKEEGYDRESNPLSYRTYCQKLGSTKRNEDKNYWVNSFEALLMDIIRDERLELNKSNPFWERCVIVDDCRYENEVGLGLKHNATMIFLSAGDRELPEEKAEWRNHESEALANAIENGDEEKKGWFDYYFLNDGDDGDLRVKARAMAPIWCGLQASSLPIRIEEDDRLETGDVKEMLNDILDVLMKEFEEDDDTHLSDEGSD